MYDFSNQVGKTFSGEDFNKMASEYDLSFFKILKRNLCHNGMKYVPGLNKDPKPFNPNGKCKAGGLYFVQEPYVKTWCVFGRLIAKVTIPDTAQVYIDSYNKFKADQIIISEPKPLLNWEGWKDRHEALFYSGDLLRSIPTNRLTAEDCLIATLYSIHPLRNYKYIPDKFYTKAMARKAVQVDWQPLISMPEEYKTRDICLAAITKHPSEYFELPEKFRTDIEFLTRFCNNSRGCNNLLGKMVPIFEEALTAELAYDLVNNTKGIALEFIPERLSTPELNSHAQMLLLLAIKYTPEIVKRVRPQFLTRDMVDTAYEMVPNNPDIKKIAKKFYETKLD